jgi:hypothetical protein
MIDQPTADGALRALDPLVGEWRLTAVGPDGKPWPGETEWKLWREGEPFPQRFAGRFEDEGRRIAGRWEKAEDGVNYTADFDLTYVRMQ